MTSKNFNKPNNFNPILIISQIFLIMSINYILLIFFTILFNTFFGIRIHKDQIFSSELFDFKENLYGYSTLLAYFFTNLFMISFYVVLIDKANKILDYVITNLIIHVILTALVNNFPLNYFWWIINGSIAASVILISEYISLKIDQKEIKLVQFK